MALKKSQRSLRAWTKQKWRTKSGKNEQAKIAKKGKEAIRRKEGK